MNKESRTSHTVVVIGAGAAGLSCSRVLINAGFKVICLEARERVGGRVFTMSLSGIPVDLGASWLHGAGDENHLHSLATQLNLHLHSTAGDESSLYDHSLELPFALFDVNGRRISITDASNAEEKLTLCLRQAAQLGLKLNHCDDKSLIDLLNIAQTLNPSLVPSSDDELAIFSWMLARIEGWFGADCSSISGASFSNETIHSGGHSLVIDGFNKIINSLSKGIDVRCHNICKSITCTDCDCVVTTADGSVFPCDAVVVSVPLGVLKASEGDLGAISFNPPLPFWKRFAINSAGFGVYNKIAMIFDRIFWPHDAEFIGTVALTTSACGYFLSLYPSTGIPILIYMNSGALSENMELLDNAEQISIALGHLKNMFGDVPEPKETLLTRWGSDPFARGSFTFEKVGVNENFYDELSRAVHSRIFFCGEHTNAAQPGSVHGAASSGVRAAKEVIESLSDVTVST